MIHNGDCLEILPSLPADSFDALVTDPPAGIAFMGADWDKDKGGRDEWVTWLTLVMRESLRVMKPGAHGLVWSLPRTSHWTATALENAGFEIRDCITHLFGTGFPKSLDISKAIDKAAGAEREITGRKNYTAPDIRGNSYDQAHVSERDRLGVVMTAPATDLAKQWQGWGTALKPAAEFWWLVRKPLSEKTVALNVEKWGVGGINIDASRIEFANSQDKAAAAAAAAAHRACRDQNEGRTAYGDFNNGPASLKPYLEKMDHGRFPANLLFSHNPDCEDVCTEGCAVKELDGQSGPCKTGDIRPGTLQGFGGGKNTYGAGRVERSFKSDDATGASRFFYCAKASRSDRGEGNSHPTVKSTKLMEYLIRLITPPKGKILDPFAGSGSTLVAAKASGFDAIGIEREKHFAEIASKREAS